MSKGLHESDAQYQWLLTLFYIPYILFEWMALMWKIVPPHIWAFATVLTWFVRLDLSEDKRLTISGESQLHFKQLHSIGKG